MVIKSTSVAKTIYETLEDPYAFATVLNKICLDLFTSEYYNWEPETVEDELKKITEFIADINLDKIQAVSTLVSTEQFYNYYEPFEAICNCFNSEEPRFEVATPLYSVNLCWGLMEASLNDSEEFNKPDPFSPEVKAYIQQIFKKDGLSKVPQFVLDKFPLKGIEYEIPDLDAVQIRYQKEFEVELYEIMRTRVDRIKNSLSLLG